MKNNSVINYNKITAKEGLQNKKTHLNYAQLIKLLEEKGIGRPSTFASIVDKIISRGYVKISDVDGDKKEYKNYELIDKTLKLKTELLDYGKEKNKLVLEPLGFIVLEFLLHNFNSFFDYDFTSLMENELDQISSNTKLFSDSSTSFDLDKPNELVTLFDAAIPGTMPSLNKYCVEQTIKTGIIDVLTRYFHNICQNRYERIIIHHYGHRTDFLGKYASLIKILNGRKFY